MNGVAGAVAGRQGPVLNKEDTPFSANIDQIDTLGTNRVRPQVVDQLLGRVSGVPSPAIKRELLPGILALNWTSVGITCENQITLNPLSVRVYQTIGTPLKAANAETAKRHLFCSADSLRWSRPAPCRKERREICCDEIVRIAVRAVHERGAQAENHFGCAAKRDVLDVDRVEIMLLRTVARSGRNPSYILPGQVRNRAVWSRDRVQKLTRLRMIQRAKIRRIRRHRDYVSVKAALKISVEIHKSARSRIPHPTFRKVEGELILLTSDVLVDAS